jgi:hypothetical protein
MADVDADEDVEEEGEEIDGDEEMQSGEADDGATHGRSSNRTLPRIVFRWTRELTLARTFDYLSVSGNERSWGRARSVWVGGIAN